MIQIISQEYKKLEGEIFDYAVYLQHNELFTSLNFEPKPFSAVEKHILYDLNKICDFFMDPEESVEVKSKKMKEFLLDKMRYFRIKVRLV